MWTDPIDALTGTMITTIVTISNIIDTTRTFGATIGNTINIIRIVGSTVLEADPQTLGWAIRN